MRQEAKRPPSIGVNDFSLRRRVPPFQALQAFEATARFGSVRRAAEFLSRDHAVISRHLRTMETWVGIKLFDRTPTGSVLTDAGIAYFNRITRALDLLCRATDREIGGGKARLQIGCTPEFALQWLWARLDRFTQENPGIDAEVHTGQVNAHGKTMLSDTELRFVLGDSNPLANSSQLNSVAVARTPLIAVASPRYMEQSTPIQAPSDLLAHQLLHEDGFDRWQCWFEAHAVAHSGEWVGTRLWQSLIVLDAARQGRGVALCDGVTVADDIEAGRLVEIGKGSPLFAPKLMGTWYLVSRADLDSAMVARFQRWITLTILKSYSQPK